MTTSKSLVPALGLGLLLCLPAGAAAQSNRDCLSCHNDTGLTGKHDGATISMFVDPARYAASRPGRLRRLPRRPGEEGTAARREDRAGNVQQVPSGGIEAVRAVAPWRGARPRRRGPTDLRRLSREP